jgi:GNAT superfamily N-acetyltransferase
MKVAADEEKCLTEPWSIRPARAGDASMIAELLLEGFGYEYGGLLQRPGGRQLIERIHMRPRYLRGMIVAVDSQDQPIGVAGLRTQELQLRPDWTEERMIIEELGIGAAVMLEFYSMLTEPMPYQPRNDEAYIYSVAVTSAWRGRGIADGLLDYLHEEARHLRKRAAVLEVAENNQPARRLYERHGYTLIKRRRGLLAWLPLGVPARLLLGKVL